MSEEEEPDEAPLDEEVDEEEGKEIEVTEGSEVEETEKDESDEEASYSEEEVLSVSAADKVRQARDNVELDRRHYVIAPAMAITVGLLVFGLLGTLSSPDKAAANNTTIQSELTDYQKKYVDCPARYLETCTKMSKIPTEKISFWKKEGDRLYFKLSDGRAIISTLPNSTSPGEFVTYMAASEVERAMNSSSAGGTNSTVR